MWTGDDAKPDPADITVKPDTPGRDVDSDELSFAKWRRSPSVDRKKKKKSNLKHAITPEQMIYARQARSERAPFQEDPASSGMESPATAFAETVNKSTGYSPLNPTVSLHSAFHDLVPLADEPQPFARSMEPSGVDPWDFSSTTEAENKTSMASPASPIQPLASKSSSDADTTVGFGAWAARIKGKKSRTASPVIRAASPIVETPSIPTFLPLTAAPTPTAASGTIPSVSPVAQAPIDPAGARAPFASVRRALFQRAFSDSIKGVKFDDTHIYVYSARSRAGVAHKPLVVHARSDFLQAASSVFSDEVYGRCIVDPQSVLGRRATKADYGYDCDSDLEEEEDDIDAGVDAAEAASVKATVPIRPPAKSSHTSREATPKSSTLSMTDLEVMSLDDFKSEHSISEVAEETNRTMADSALTDNTATPLRTPSKPALSLTTNDAVLNWRAAQEKMTAVPVERALEASPPPVTKDTGGAATKADISVSVEDARERTLFISDSAHKTWQALLLFLYNDDLEFAPLRSQRRSAQKVSDAPTCSPKSMYRLAAKLGLDGLKEKSFAALTQALTKENIVDELFSDFTWRYPEVLKMETDVFHRYSSDAGVQAAMAEKFQDIAHGQLPHSSVVLNSLFMRFIGAPSSTGTPRLR